jgi:hypothetical protein
MAEIEGAIGRHFQSLSISFLYVRLTRNWLHFEQPSSYSRYIWSSLIDILYTLDSASNYSAIQKLKP